MGTQIVNLAILWIIDGATESNGPELDSGSPGFKAAVSSVLMY